MGDYTAAVEIVSGSESAVDPARLVITHHRSEAAQLEISMPTGGLFLHAAVAMCVSNDTLGLASERGTPVRLGEVTHV